MLAIGCWLLAIGCWLLAIGCWLLAIGFSTGEELMTMTSNYDYDQ